VKSELNEIMAYGISRADLFYTHALTQPDYVNLTANGYVAQVEAFQTDFVDAGNKVEEDIASWAWEQPWMRVRMLRSNPPPQEREVWNYMCAALQRKNWTLGTLCDKLYIKD
jgi:hypothetical protein